MPSIKATITLEDIGNGIVYDKTLTIAEDETAWQYYELANGAANQAVPFNLTTGVATIDILLITSNYQVSWRQSATDTAITLDANKVHVLFGTNITALLMSNSSGSTATVKIYIAGT